MTAFWLIFKSYFKRDFDSIGSSIVAPLFLAAGLITALSLPKPPPGSIALPETFTPILLGLMIAAGNASFVVAYGMKHVLETGTGHLYPRFIQRHLQVSAVALLPFLLLPVAVLTGTGYPVLSSFAMILLVSALAAWVTLLLGNNFLSGLLLLVVLRSVYELLGLARTPLMTARLGTAAEAHRETTIPLVVIGLSAVLMVLLGRYVLTRQPRGELKKQYPFAGLLLTPTSAPQRMIRPTLSTLFKTAQHHRSHETMRKLIRLSLFSPDYAFRSLFVWRSFPVYAAMVLGLTVVLYFAGNVMSNPDRIVPSLGPAAAVFAIYHFIALAVSTDFLVHRVQLPTLWLSSSMQSRRQFTSAVVLSYIEVAGWMFLWPTCLLIAVACFTPFLPVHVAAAVAAMGLAVFLMLVSLSLVFSGSVRSQHCTGWVIPNFTILVIVLQFLWLSGFFNNPTTVWATAAAALLLGLSLLLIGSATLNRVELSFQGPDL